MSSDGRRISNRQDSPPQRAFYLTTYFSTRPQAPPPHRHRSLTTSPYTNLHPPPQTTVSASQSSPSPRTRLATPRTGTKCTTKRSSRLLARCVSTYPAAMTSTLRRAISSRCRSGRRIRSAIRSMSRPSLSIRIVRRFISITSRCWARWWGKAR
jgi:hypothetical protein